MTPRGRGRRYADCCCTPPYTKNYKKEDLMGFGEGREKGSKNIPLAEKVAKRKGARREIGRPKGGNLINHAVLNITDKDRDAVMAAVVSVAKDPEHKNFGHASKLLMDRFAHISHFEKEKDSEHRGGITINIQGIGKAISEPIDGDLVSGSTNDPA